MITFHYCIDNSMPKVINNIVAIIFLRRSAQNESNNFPLEIFLGGFPVSQYNKSAITIQITFDFFQITLQFIEILVAISRLLSNHARQDVGDARTDSQEETTRVVVIVGEIRRQIAVTFQLNDVGRTAAAVPGSVE